MRQGASATAMDACWPAGSTAFPWWKKSAVTPSKTAQHCNTRGGKPRRSTGWRCCRRCCARCCTRLSTEFAATLPGRREGVTDAPRGAGPQHPAQHRLQHREAELHQGFPPGCCSVAPDSRVRTPHFLACSTRAGHPPCALINSWRGCSNGALLPLQPLQRLDPGPVVDLASYEPRDGSAMCCRAAFVRTVASAGCAHSTPRSGTGSWVTRAPAATAARIAPGGSRLPPDGARGGRAARRFLDTAELVAALDGEG
jgi:hypothetical protein